MNKIEKLTTYFFIFFLLFNNVSTAFSQSTAKHTVSGYIKDAKTGEFLIGASVYSEELIKGATTNTYGFYSLTLPAGKHTIVVKFLGYEVQKKQIDLKADFKYNVSLNLEGITGKEVVISDERGRENIQSSQMGKMEIDIKEIKSLPAFMGEADVMKALQLMPGMQSAGEGNAGFYVRGGGPDQNLILLDGAVLYNATHLFGFFSVFNPDAIKNVELTKGGMPANYGGRLSSVIDITMKEGNNKEFKAEGGLGLISSRLTLEGPIKKDTSSFIISARRTYIDLLIDPFIPKSSSFKGTGYYFYDLNAKVNYIVSDKDRIFLSGYFGKDVFSFNNKDAGFQVSVPWGNASATARWNHLFSNKLFMNTTAIFSDYDFSFGATQADFEFVLSSGVRDYTLKTDFNYFPNVRNNIKFGAEYTYHTFRPYNATANQGEVEFDTGETVNLYAHDAGIYVSNDFDLTEKIKINFGLRYSYFQHAGPFNRYVKNEVGGVSDTIKYERGDNIKDYGGLEPRFSARYSISNSSAIKASYTRNYQYIHLASLSAVSLPTDIWMPSTSLVQPQLGTQYSAGYFKNFSDNTFETSFEAYYKSMKNQVEYREGFLPEETVTENVDQSLVFGSGESFGGEFFIKKSKGQLTGWVGYTLSWTNRFFPEINNGMVYPAKFDRRHDLSVVSTYKFNEKWECSAVFVYGTGNAITLPIERYIIEGKIVNNYGPRNQARMPAYHRADISVTYHVPKKKKLESSWNFSVFNVYNRLNPFFIYFANEGDITQNELKITAKQVSLFPILPSVTWNFKF
jgi:hypothetical protein